MRPPLHGAAAAPAVDVGEGRTPKSSAIASPPQAPDPWQPIGSVLERLFQMLDFVPEADEQDEAWRPWHCRPGDVVEVLGAKGDLLDRYFVTAASPRYFKIEDRRVFAQQGGWPLVSGKTSPIRARKVRP